MKKQTQEVWLYYTGHVREFANISKGADEFAIVTA